MWCFSLHSLRHYKVVVFGTELDYELEEERVLWNLRAVSKVSQILLIFHLLNTRGSINFLFCDHYYSLNFIFHLISLSLDILLLSSISQNSLFSFSNNFRADKRMFSYFYFLFNIITSTKWIEYYFTQLFVT